MSADPHTAQQRRNRRALAAAKRKGPEAVIETCAALIAEMNDSGIFPDSWQEVERAQCDAALAIRYGRTLPTVGDR